MKSLLIIITFLFVQSAQAKVLFEGWFEVYSGAKKIGFSVQRYEFDNNKFKATTYLKSNADGNNVTESIKAFAGPDLKPKSYSYTSKVGKDLKVIDATFSGTKMNLKINDGKNETKKTVVLKDGTFLSVFTPYVLMAQQPDKNGDGGLKVSNKNIVYRAVAEEDGAAYNGVLRVTSLDKVKGKEAFKILNKFKDSDFISWITPKGEFLLVRSPKLNIEVRISENMSEATKNMGVNLSDLKLLFGKVPGDTVANKPEATETEATNTQDASNKIEEKKKKLFEKHDVKGISKQPGVMIKDATKPAEEK